MQLASGRTHARMHVYNEMSADRPLCSAFAKMAGISSPRPARTRRRRRRKWTKSARSGPLSVSGSRQPRQLMIAGRKSFYVFILAGPSVLCLSRDCYCRRETCRRDFLSITGKFRFVSNMNTKYNVLEKCVAFSSSLTMFHFIFKFRVNYICFIIEIKLFTIAVLTN